MIIKSVKYIFSHFLFLISNQIHLTHLTNILYIDGKVVEQDFLDEAHVESEKKIYGIFTRDFGPITLGEDEYFLMGDNRNHSIDSRLIGYIDFEDDVVGKVFLKVF